VTGSTFSDDFPTTPGAFQTHPAGSTDVFVTKLDESGLIYSTYLGGTDADGVGLGDGGGGIAVGGGTAYVTGSTFSTDFPLTPAPIQGSNAEVMDAFVTRLDAAGSALLYSTYLGGSSRDPAQAIAVDPTGAAYVAGYTSSIDLLTEVPYQASNAGVPDAFVAKLAEAPPPTCQDRPITIQVTAPNLTTAGTPGPDVINGTPGFDTIHAGGGNDVICGLDDNDLLFGGKGHDEVFGDDGRDQIWGEDGNDILHGMASGGGGDTIFGGDGSDTLYGNADSDVLFGGSGVDTLYGNADNDDLFGGDNNDTLIGSTGNDALYGEDGNDDIYGNAGLDDLYGNDGKDFLYGGPQSDYCDGGAPSTIPGDTPSSCDTPPPNGINFP